eukprot:COSAG01_NODE_4397_length_5067_cov_2.350443_2_plen_477_part_00
MLRSTRSTTPATELAAPMTYGVVDEWFALDQQQNEPTAAALLLPLPPAAPASSQQRNQVLPTATPTPQPAAAVDESHARTCGRGRCRCKVGQQCSWCKERRPNCPPPTHFLRLPDVVRKLDRQARQAFGQAGPVVDTCNRCIIKCQECKCEETSEVLCCDTCSKRNYTSAGDINVGTAMLSTGELRLRGFRLQVKRCSNCHSFKIGKQKQTRHLRSNCEEASAPTSTGSNHMMSPPATAAATQSIPGSGSTPGSQLQRQVVRNWTCRVSNKVALLFVQYVDEFWVLHRRVQSETDAAERGRARRALEDFWSRWLTSPAIICNFPDFATRRETCRQIFAHVRTLPENELEREYITTRRLVDPTGDRSRFKRRNEQREVEERVVRQRQEASTRTRANQLQRLPTQLAFSSPGPAMAVPATSALATSSVSRPQRPGHSQRNTAATATVALGGGTERGLDGGYWATARTIVNRITRQQHD